MRTVYQPGAVNVPEAWVRFATFDPVTCGRYVLRSAVLANDPLNPLGEGDDDNGWRVRVGSDDDGDPTNQVPANYDDPDGIPGTNDEIVIGLAQTTYQQDMGSVRCLTLYQYVAPNQSTVTFNNFDMDGNTSVTYYAPSDATGIAGTVSNSTGWNPPVSPASVTRGGDTIASPEPGWWRIESCIGSNNQFVQEGTTGRDAFFLQPPTPSLSISKSDGTTTVVAGATLTYAIVVSNTAEGTDAGAALNLVATDTLPPQATFSGCAIQAPATGTCTESAGVVTAKPGRLAQRWRLGNHRHLGGCPSRRDRDPDQHRRRGLHGQPRERLPERVRDGRRRRGGAPANARAHTHTHADASTYANAHATTYVNANADRSGCAKQVRRWGGRPGQ